MVWYNPATWRMDPKWPVLSGLPTVPFRMLFLCALDLLTLWWFWHTTEMHLHAAVEAMRAGKMFAPAETLVLGVQGAWLAFLAGAHGFAYAGYKTKRNTSWDGNVEEDRGGEMSAAPMVNPSSVRASNQARMQGSGTTADAPAIAVPAAIVPVPPPAAVQQAPPVQRAAPAAPANIEGTDGGTPMPPEGAGDATASGDGFEGADEEGEPVQGSGFTAAADRGTPGKAEPANTVNAAPLAHWPTEASE